MNGITRAQARLLKKQTKKLYGRNFIPLITADSSITIGDILLSERDESPVIDSSVFDNNLVETAEGRSVNTNITSSSKVNLTTKLKGEAILPEHFKVEDAGMMVEFTNENQLFLKVMGLRQQSMKNFIDFRNHILNCYTKGEVSSKIYIVRGVVYADKYYLQYSGSKGGTLAFNLDAEASNIDAELKADFSFKWKKNVGYNIDGSNGGVLGYRVSGVRLKRHLITPEIHEKIMRGMPESDVLDNISFEERTNLLNNDALEVFDLTDEVLLAREENGVEYREELQPILGNDLLTREVELS